MGATEIVSRLPSRSPSNRVRYLVRRIKGQSTPGTLLGRIWVDTGEYGRAETAFVRTARHSTEALGPIRPLNTHCHEKLRADLAGPGRHEEAEATQTQVLELGKEILGLKHPSTIQAMADVAVAQHKLGLYEEAEEAETQVVELFKEIIGRKHPGTVSAMANLASIWGELGRYAEAEEAKKGDFGVKSFEHYYGHGGFVRDLALPREIQ